LKRAARTGFALSSAERRHVASLADIDLSIVHVRHHLSKVAHVEPLAAAWALHEMIGVGFGSLIRLAPALA
jgi:hypothetical protein